MPLCTIANRGSRRPAVWRGRARATGRGRAAGLTVGLLVLAATVACGRNRGTTAPDGPASEGEKNRYIQRAIRQSSEGVILLPSKRAEAVFELPRLNEIAQAMRQPMAGCFLRRAVETMALTGDPERPYEGVPEGQLKIRARISPSGETVRAEVLESGFADAQMEPCLTNVVRGQHWPANTSGNTHYIDIVYWVSLGRQGDIFTDKFADHMRREQTAAGVKAKNCLQGRVDAGDYEVHGLNLINHDGASMAARVDHATLPEPIRACIAEAMQTIRLPRDTDAFVRPVAPVVTFTVGRDGTVGVADEQWLKMVELEERAAAAQRRRELQAEDPTPVDELPAKRPQTVFAGAGASTADPAAAGEDDAASPPDVEGAAPPEPAAGAPDAGQDPARQDPGKGGLRLPLGPGR